VSSIRSIEERDLPAVISLMCDSFPRRDEAYFQRALERLAARRIPEGTETWGYLIDDDGPKGSVLAISSWHGPDEAPQLFVNISTWCVAPSHRGPLARQLYDRAGARDDAVNTNLSAAAHTLRTLDRLGFEPWTTGQFLAIGTRGRTTPAGLRTGAAAARDLPGHEQRLLADHDDKRFLTACLDCDGRLMPLVFVRRRIRGLVPAAQLIYCADTALLQAHMGTVLPWLRRRGCPFLILDASAPPAGLVGRFYPGQAAKYIRGRRPLLDVDHSYSEMLYLGF
jgi:hypothetical protein